MVVLVAAAVVVVVVVAVKATRTLKGACAQGKGPIQAMGVHNCDGIDVAVALFMRFSLVSGDAAI